MFCLLTDSIDKRVSGVDGLDVWALRDIQSQK